MPNRNAQNDATSHIFTVSAAMVGVCLTAIGLFQIIPETKNVRAIADDLMAIDATGFMVSCALAYHALRSNERRVNLERLADVIFLASMLLMAGICFVLVFKIT